MVRRLQPLAFHVIGAALLPERVKRRTALVIAQGLIRQASARFVPEAAVLFMARTQLGSGGGMPCGQLGEARTQRDGLSTLEQFSMALIERSLNSGFAVRRHIIPDLKAMAEAARRAGARLAVQSAYRGFATQKATFDYWVRVHGYAVAVKESARAGHSEHQLGTTIDFRTALKYAVGLWTAVIRKIQFARNDRGTANTARMPIAEKNIRTKPAAKSETLGLSHRPPP